MWIRIDTDIAQHRKTLVLRTSLGRPTPVTVGFLVMLFSRLADNECDGDISEIPAAVIEEWAGWDGEHGKFDAAFRENFVTDGVIDGWEERQGTLMARQRRDRERKRAERAAKVQRMSAGRPKDKTRTSGGNPGATVTVTDTELQKPKGAPKPRADKAAPWMSVIRPIYRERYDADPPAQTVKALRPLVAKHGDAAVADRFRVYCERTEGRYFDPFRFAATWGEWTPNAGSPPRASPLADEYAVFDDLMRAVNRMGGYQRVPPEWHQAQSEPVRRAISAAGGLKALADADEIGFRIKRKTFAEALAAAAHETTNNQAREATA